MSKETNELRICTENLRVEYDGGVGPTHIVVPLVLPVGQHRNLSVRVEPRSNVALDNSVDVGDAFQATFTRSHSTTGGGSFFITASHARAFGTTQKPYAVVHLPDFRGVRFQLTELDVEQEPIGLQLAFPISSYDGNSNDEFFAKISLEKDGGILQSEIVPREMHTNAGRILLVSGYSEEMEIKVFGSYPRGSNAGRITTASPKPNIAGLRRPYLHISELHRCTLGDLRSLATDFDGVHLYTNVAGGKVLMNDVEVDAGDLFQQLDGLGLDLLYLDTCNSVQVVSSFRDTDIKCMVAATENLYVNYAEEFETLFYEALGSGDFISEAFHKGTAAKGESEFIFTRSGEYDPMFLDLKTDFCFQEVHRAT